MLVSDAKKTIALGTFDGLHRGHAEVLRLAKDSAYTPCVLLFTEHPLCYISGSAPPALLTPRIRDRILCEMGVSAVQISFEAIMQMSPERFFYDVLLDELHAASLACGENYTFGCGGKGDVVLLRRLCRQAGVELKVAPMLQTDGREISSTHIREKLENGEIEAANAMLGRPFSYDFEVVSGDRRGRLLGFPTINQFFPEGFVHPKRGVYAATVTLGGKAYAAVTDFGKRPTIGTKTVRSETCILGFSGDLYGQNVEVGLLSFLRPEIKFENLQALSAQIAQDSAAARKIFENSLAKAREKR